MEPNVLKSHSPAQSGRAQRVRWLPALLLIGVALAVLLALGGTRSAQSAPASPMADPWATEFCLTYGMACATGDFDGDGDADIIAFNRTVNTSSPLVTNAGDVWVMRSNGTSFDGPELWRTGFATGSTEIPRVGDFDGDGKDDIVVFVRGDSGNAFVSISNGYGFESRGQWIGGFCKSSEICDVGDFNGDGKDDLARFTRNVYSTNLNTSEWGKVYVALSSGSSFSAISYSWIQKFCMGPLSGLTYPEVCGTGDFNGDGLADVIAFSKVSGTVWVALNSGSADFNSSSLWIPYDNSDKAFSFGNEISGVGDFNGDGRDDVITYLRSLYSGKVGWVYVGLSNGSGFPESTITLWSDNFCVGNEICGSGATIDGVSGYLQVSHTGDFNGDTHDDVVRFMRNTNSSYPGYVYVKLAYGNSFVDYVGPTNTPTATPTSTFTPTATNTPTNTLTPTVTNTPTITPTPSNTPTPMPPRAWMPLVLH